MIIQTWGLSKPSCIKFQNFQSLVRFVFKNLQHLVKMDIFTKCFQGCAATLYHMHSNNKMPAITSQLIERKVDYKVVHIKSLNIKKHQKELVIWDKVTSTWPTSREWRGIWASGLNHWQTIRLQSICRQALQLLLWTAEQATTSKNCNKHRQTGRHSNRRVITAEELPYYRANNDQTTANC